MWTSLLVFFGCVALVWFLFVVWFCTSKDTNVLSIRVKVFALLGIISSEMEKQRWNLTQDNPDIRSEELLIAFGGGAMALMRLPRAEFLRTFQSFDCDKLFLTDPDQSWYLNDTARKWKGIDEMNGKLSDICAKYKYVIAVGNCMGASAALLFSHHFHYTIAFIPQINFTTEKRFKFRMGSKRIPKQIRNHFHELLAESIQSSKGPVKIHLASDRNHDVEQVSYLSESDTHNLEIVCHQIGGEGSITQKFKKLDMLVPLVASAFDYVHQEPE